MIADVRACLLADLRDLLCSLICRHNKPPPVIDPKCEANPNGKVPHESDCSKYYECSNGNPCERNCQEGFHFNKELETCDSPDNANCETNAPPKCEPENQLRPHESDCSKYYECLNGISYERTCQEGFHFNKQSETCDSPENAGCETNTPPKCEPGIQYLPNEKDCSKYYQCSNGVPYEQTCQNGLHFNRNLGTCDWPENAGCEKH